MLVTSLSRMRSRQGKPRMLLSIILFGFGLFCMFGERRPLKSSPRMTAHGTIYTNVHDVAASDWDAILILGGGVPASLNAPPSYVQQRCDDAAAIRGDSNIPILTLSAGTAHLPQLLSPEGLPVWESTSSAAYLKEKHNIQTNVYLETTSYDTIGNAFFARTSHTDIVNWRKLLIITNQFHMDRTKAIFDWIFGIENDRNPPQYQLAYFSSPNVGLSQQALQARLEHEKRSTETVRTKLAPKYTTLKDVWTFINENHDLYTANKLIVGATKVGSQVRNEALKESYGANK